jgi:hypothetical protein
LKLTAISILLAAASYVSAQEVIVQQEPIEARNLTGIVLDSTNAPLIGVSVTFFQCPSTYPNFQTETNIKALAKTNAKGKFSIQEKRGSKPYCLRFQRNGFNQYVIKVHLVPSASDLRITMVPAA